MYTSGRHPSAGVVGAASAPHRRLFAALALGGSGPLALDSILLRRKSNQPRGAVEPTV
jgi:hypothetical protein